jgi:hypothetical protein
MDFGGGAEMTVFHYEFTHAGQTETSWGESPDVALESLDVSDVFKANAMSRIIGFYKPKEILRKAMEGARCPR